MQNNVSKHHKDAFIIVTMTKTTITAITFLCMNIEHVRNVYVKMLSAISVY